MLNFVVRYFVEILCGLIVAILSYFMKRISCKIKRLELVENGMQSLLRDRIIQAYNKNVDRGYCPIYDLDNIEKLYASYHELGGNGTITELMNKVRTMPTEPITQGKSDYNHGGEKT